MGGGPGQRAFSPRIALGLDNFLHLGKGSISAWPGDFKIRQKTSPDQKLRSLNNTQGRFFYSSCGEGWQRRETLGINDQAHFGRQDLAEVKGLGSLAPLPALTPLPL